MKRALTIFAVAGFIACFFPWISYGKYLGGTYEGIDSWIGAIILINCTAIVFLTSGTANMGDKWTQRFIKTSFLVCIISTLLLTWMILTGWIMAQERYGLFLSFFIQIALARLLYHQMSD